jgi:hypothetical protein
MQSELRLLSELPSADNYFNSDFKTDCWRSEFEQARTRNGRRCLVETPGSNPRPSAIRVTRRVDPGREFPAVISPHCRQAGRRENLRLDKSCNRVPGPRLG